MTITFDKMEHLQGTALFLQAHFLHWVSVIVRNNLEFTLILVEHHQWFRHVNRQPEKAKHECF